MMQTCPSWPTLWNAPPPEALDERPRTPLVEIAIGEKGGGEFICEFIRASGEVGEGSKFDAPSFSPLVAFLRAPLELPEPHVIRHDVASSSPDSHELRLYPRRFLPLARFLRCGTFSKVNPSEDIRRHYVPRRQEPETKTELDNPEVQGPRVIIEQET